MDYSEKLSKFKSLVEDIRHGMLVTDDPTGSGLRSRPMATAGVDDDGTLWFFTALSSEKVQEIYHDRSVNVAYAQPSDTKYVSVAGEAKIVTDSVKKRQYYSKIQDAWFDGPEDPQASLIKVVPTEVEYWDDNDSTIVTFAKIAAAAVLPNNEYKGSENERFAVK